MILKQGASQVSSCGVLIKLKLRVVQAKAQNCEFVRISRSCCVGLSLQKISRTSCNTNSAVFFQLSSCLPSSSSQRRTALAGITAAHSSWRGSKAQQLIHAFHFLWLSFSAPQVGLSGLAECFPDLPLFGRSRFDKTRIANQVHSLFLSASIASAPSHHSSEAYTTQHSVAYNGDYRSPSLPSGRGPPQARHR